MIKFNYDDYNKLSFIYFCWLTTNIILFYIYKYCWENKNTLILSVITFRTWNIIIFLLLYGSLIYNYDIFLEHLSHTFIRPKYFLNEKKQKFEGCFFCSIVNVMTIIVKKLINKMEFRFIWHHFCRRWYQKQSRFLFQSRSHYWIKVVRDWNPIPNSCPWILLLHQTILRLLFLYCTFE